MSFVGQGGVSVVDGFISTGQDGRVMTRPFISRVVIDTERWRWRHTARETRDLAGIGDANLSGSRRELAYVEESRFRVVVVKRNYRHDPAVRVT